MIDENVKVEETQVAEQDKNVQQNQDMNVAEVDNLNILTAIGKSMGMDVSKGEQALQGKSKENKVQTEVKTEKAPNKTETQTEKAKEPDKIVDKEAEDDDDLPPSILNSKSKKGVAFTDFKDENFVNYIKEKLSINDPSTLINSVNKWRADSNKYSEVKGQYEKVMEDLQSLPEDLTNALSAYANGQDYSQVFINNQKRLKYDIPFENQERKAVVNHYFPEWEQEIGKEIEDLGIEDEAKQTFIDKRINTLYNLSRNNYQRDKSAFDGERASIVEKQRLLKDKFKHSVDSSVAKLKDKYPDFDDKSLNEIKKSMTNGTIQNRLFDKNGFYKEEAAEVIFEILYGAQEREAFAKREYRKGLQDGRAELLRRTTEGERVTKGGQGGATKDINASDKEAIDFLKKVVPTKSVY